MDLILKYTGAKRFYELDESVIETLENMHKKLAMLILFKLEKLVPTFKPINNRSQLIAARIESEQPVFFAIRYIYEEEGAPYIFNLFDITVDDYLDLYNQNKVHKDEVKVN